MKKTIIILLTLCLCVTLFSCKKEENTEKQYDYPPITVNLFEKYQNVIDKLKLPNGFVYYEDVKAFGEFKYFRPEIYDFQDLNKEFSEYAYAFVDSAGATLYLKVEPIGEEEEKVSNFPKILQIGSNDMRRTGISGRNYAIGELVYKYKWGKLQSINWEYNGYIFSLSGEDGLSKYPETEETIIGKLLNSDTAVETIESVFDFEADSASEGG